MGMTQHHRLLILGSGSAGLTAAIYAARAGLRPVVIHGMQPGGQLTITTDVENYPGFADPIQGPWLMEQMTKQAENCGATLVHDHIREARLNQKPFTLVGEKETYTCDALIIATGASAKWLGLDSEQKFNGRGVSACATCDGAFYRNRDVAVIGGGNSAKEEALYLANICNKVTLIHRRDAFRGEQVLTDRILKHPKIDVAWNKTVDEFLGDNTGLTGLRLKDTQTGEMSELLVHGAFIAIGHQPNTDIFKGQLTMDDTGYLRVDPGTVNTNIPGVFAAGDVADSVYRQAVTAAGMGCMAALDANRYLENLVEEQPAA
jgi:thioredoxin reductase (NADPH)